MNSTEEDFKSRKGRGRKRKKEVARVY